MQQRPACAGKTRPSTPSYNNESTIASTGPDRPIKDDRRKDWAEHEVRSGIRYEMAVIDGPYVDLFHSMGAWGGDGQTCRCVLSVANGGKVEGPWRRKKALPGLNAKMCDDAFVQMV
jgi:hypothetical protein